MVSSFGNFLAMGADKLTQMCIRDNVLVTCHNPYTGELYQTDDMHHLIMHILPAVVFYQDLYIKERGGYFTLADKWGNAYCYSFSKTGVYLIRWESKYGIYRSIRLRGGI